MPVPAGFDACHPPRTALVIAARPQRVSPLLAETALAPVHQPEDRRVRTLTDKSVLITGGAGSFGHRSIARILQRDNPRKIIVYPAMS